MTDLQELMALLEKWRAKADAQNDAAKACVRREDVEWRHCYADVKNECAAELEAILRSPAFAEMARDAERYRWMREHFRFANDSMNELWFDESLEPDDSGVPADLDQSIDAQRHGRGDGTK